MNEVKIVKLPLMGKPFSYKTRKQGRRSVIENDIQRSNDTAIRHLKNMINEEVKTTEDVREFFRFYKSGSNAFLNSIHKQIRSKGFDKLSQAQIDAVKRTLKIS